MGKHALLLALAIATLLPRPAAAFWVSDHKTIASAAIKNLQNCGLLPAQWDQGIEEAILKADADEDYNLFRKWSFYSHFYNPNKPLNMRRFDSSVTVKESSDAIERLGRSEAGSADAWEAYRMLGRISHHLQDAGAPPHVVPVNHFIHDGFEAFDATAAFAEAAAHTMDCPSMADVMEPVEILRTTALQTLSNAEGNFSYLENGAARASTWGDLFWREGAGNDFGSYGVVGNNFGKAQVNKGGVNFEFDPKLFTDFKVQEMMLAMKATRAAILWAKSKNPAAF